MIQYIFFIKIKFFSAQQRLGVTKNWVSLPPNVPRDCGPESLVSSSA